jgi:hypothetical protein
MADSPCPCPRRHRPPRSAFQTECRSHSGCKGPRRTPSAHSTFGKLFAPAHSCDTLRFTIHPSLPSEAIQRPDDWHQITSGLRAFLF